MLRYILVLGILFGGPTLPNPAWAIEVADAVITTAIMDREPADRVGAFPIQNGRLYCFSRIVGAEESTTIFHVWFRDKQLMSRVALPVNSPDWRTWSAKRFLEDEPGEWHVEIQDMNGKILE